jgi:UDP-N-acetylmuramoyl-tripeptide--D-alanyl-D-alanine ligase
MQPIPLINGAVAICDDFKASVESVHAALDVLGQMQNVNRRIVVLGDIYHPPRPRVARYAAVGRQAASVADRVVLVGRRAGLYRAELAKAGRPVDVASSVVEAAALLRAQLRPGDVVLIKGRGEQKLARIALMLAGRDVRCRRVFCTYDNVLCAVCPQLSDAGGA